MPTSRREFLAMLGAGTASGALAFPVPAWKLRDAKPAAVANLDAPLPLPEGAFRRIGGRKFRVSRGISRIQFSPTGQYLVGADRDEIRVWFVSEAKAIFSMGYPAKVDLNSGRLTDVKTIATLGRVENAQEYSIQHYRFETGRTETNAGTGINAIDASAFSSTGHRVAILRNGTIHVHDGFKPKRLWEVMIKNGRSVSIAFTPDDRWLSVLAEDGIRLFDSDTGLERKPLCGDDKNAKLAGCCFPLKGREIAALQGRSLHVWNVDSGKIEQTIPVPGGASLLGYGPGDRELLVLKDGSTIAYCRDTGAELRKTNLGPCNEATLSPDGTMYATSPADAVVLVDTRTGKLHPLSADPPGLPDSLRYHSATKMTGKFGNLGWVDWNLSNGMANAVRPGVVPKHFLLDRTDDGRMLIFVKDRLEVHGPQGVQRSLPLAIPGSIPLAVISRSGHRIVGIIENGLKVWEAGDMPKTVARPAEDRLPTTQIASDRDCRYVAVGDCRSDAIAGTVSSAIVLYSAVGGHYLQTIPVPGQLTAIRMCDDGELLAVAANVGDGQRGVNRYQISIYEVSTGRLMTTFVNQEGEPRHFAFSPDNRLLLFADKNSAMLDVREARGGGSRFQQNLPGDAFSIAVAPDGASFATANYSGPLLFWHLRGQHLPTPSRPGDSQTNDLLAWLGGEDAARAFEALRTFAAWPAVALPLLRKAIAPVAEIDGSAMAKNFEQLASPNFAERERATRALIELGELAAVPARRLMCESPDAEVRQRAEQIANDVNATGANPLMLRGVELAEWIANDEAKTLLKHWASGAKAATLTRHANRALERLQKL